VKPYWLELLAPWKVTLMGGFLISGETLLAGTTGSLEGDIGV
jgi:hypothetical protein